MKPYKTALIIDDDSDLCMLLKAMLVSRIPEIHCVHSIKSGRELLLSVKPDVVFIDNNLPDGKGVLFIKEIKVLLPGAAIVMISAMAALHVEAVEYGADVFIEKPLTEDNVRKALSR